MIATWLKKFLIISSLPILLFDTLISKQTCKENVLNKTGFSLQKCITEKPLIVLYLKNWYGLPELFDVFKEKVCFFVQPFIIHSFSRNFVIRLTGLKPIAGLQWFDILGTLAKQVGDPNFTYAPGEYRLGWGIEGWLRTATKDKLFKNGNSLSYKYNDRVFPLFISTNCPIVFQQKQCCVFYIYWAIRQSSW